MLSYDQAVWLVTFFQNAPGGRNETASAIDVQPESEAASSSAELLPELLPRGASEYSEMPDIYFPGGDV